MSVESQETNMASSASIVKKKKIINWRNPFKRMLDNPVILKELRGRMRGRQSFVLLTVYLGAIAVLIGVMYVLLANQTYGGWDPSLRQTVGKAIFAAVILLELLLVSFIGPGLTSGAITSEREHQTFDLLRTTLLSARDLVLGKLGSAFSYLFLLILTALPIQSLAFLLGGVGMAEMIISILMLVVTALFYCTLGIFFSSFMKRTLSATITSYGSIVLSYLLIVIIFFMIAYVESLSYNTSQSATQETILSVILWLVICTNPFLAAIISETILVEEQSLFFTKTSLFGGSSSIYYPSPWIIFTVIYLLLTVLMIFLSIRRVRRPDR